MAPMEGLTDYTFRRAYEATFGKGRVDKYFTPFISPNQSENFLAREIRDIDSEHNKGINVVVQVMTNEPKDFIWTAKMLHEKYGYSEINLNAEKKDAVKVTPYKKLTTKCLNATTSE